MKLKLTLQRPGGSSSDLVVTCDVSATVGALATHLAVSDPHRGAHDAPADAGLTLRLIGHGSGQVVDPATPLSESGLNSGAVVSLAPASEQFSHPAGLAAATLSVLRGPDTGREYPLHSGTNIVGRERGCEVRLNDPLASRRHARINVSDVIDIVDLASANGVLMSGSPVQRAMLAPGDEITVGDTVFTVRLNATARADVLSETPAAVGFIRSPRVEASFVGQKFEAPDFPEKPGVQRFPIIAMLAPIVMGGVLYFMTQNVMSLAFVALSPLMMVGSYAEQRLSGRSAYKKALKLFWSDVEGLISEADTRAAAEVQARLLEHPSVEACANAVRDHSPLLWSRRPNDARYVEIRLGTGGQASRSTVELPSAKRAPRDVFAELRVRVAHLSRVAPVPVVAQPLVDGAVGVAGPRSAALAAARGLVAQWAALHSPAEFVIASIGSSRAAREWDWLKWLPHTSSPHSPLNAPHLASSSTAIASLLSEIEEIVELRGGEREEGVRLPTILVIIESDAPAEFGRLVALAEGGWQRGVIVLWIAPDVTQLPAACRTYVALDNSPASKVGFVHSGDLVSPVSVEYLAPEAALALARGLAPLTDLGAPIDDDSDLPRSVSFLELTGRALAHDATAVVERWQANHSILTGPFAPRDEQGAITPVTKAGTLRAIVGKSASGPLALDLRSDGPHALVGGTTGAGKSELLQAWILGMAANHSPERLSFLLVDYKGGAAFAECATLPHTVGLVTDLNTHLVRRALTSLAAELRYRERVLEKYEAKDLVSLEKKGVVEAPPSLVLVVDEFAALVSEVPEFVDGVVNVAQRGRSLGIHLILATQRPAGVIKDNLRANTNLRLALRMADEDDSRDVLGSPQAAFFDPAMPGRAVSKTGPGRLMPFQTAYAGARTGDTEPPPEIDVAELTFGTPTPWEVDEAIPRGPVAPLAEQDIARVVAAIQAGHQLAQIPFPRKPWQPELRRHYNLADRAQVPWVRKDDELVFGVLDVPDEQAQVPVAFYPDKEGNLAVYGTGGSGKSTLLRTLAVSAGSTFYGGPCHVYGLDFSARGLAMLDVLPHVGSIITGNDHERVVRLLSWLRALIDERAARFSKVDAGTIAAYRKIANQSDEARILLLVDGVANFRSAYDSGERSKWFDTFMSISSDGRPVGVHVVITTDQRGGIHPTLASSIQRRVVMRMAQTDDYGMIGVPGDILNGDSPSGRGIYEGKEVQVAVLGESSEPQEQAESLRRFARTMHKAGIKPAPAIQSLPERVSLSSLPVVRGRIALGLESESLAPQLTDTEGTFTVVGPPGSGRTTTLLTVAASVRLAEPSWEMVVISDRRSDLVNGMPWTETVIGVDAAGAWARDLLEKITRREQAHLALFVESAAEFFMSTAESDLERAAKAILRGQGLVVSELESSGMASPMGLSGTLRTSRRGIALQPDQGDGSTYFKTNFPRVNRADFVEGRGYFVEKGRARLVQVALTH